MVNALMELWNTANSWTSGWLWLLVIIRSLNFISWKELEDYLFYFR